LESKNANSKSNESNKRATDSSTAKQKKKVKEVHNDNEPDADISDIEEEMAAEEEEKIWKKLMQKLQIMLQTILLLSQKT
jgi:hypothetical protein